MNLSLFFLTVYFIFLLQLIITTSTIVYVDSSASSGGKGTSWSDAYQYLDDAIKNLVSAKSKNSSSIWMTQGVYYPQTTNRSSCFNLPENVNIYGGFIGNENRTSQRKSSFYTTLDGDINTRGNSNDNCYHVISLQRGILDSLIITNGNANKDGDGLETQQFGGGIYVGSEFNVNITLNNVQVVNNTAHLGGGMFAKESNNDIAIYDCKFNNNAAILGTYLGGYGGGVHFSMGIDVVIDNTEFIDNTAVYRGGGIYQDYGAIIKCSSCVFINNSATAGHGGAWFAENRNSQLGTTTCSIKYSNFTSNYAFGYGGACTFFTESNVHIEDCSFHYNHADNRGGALTYYEIVNSTSSNNEFFGNWATNSSTNNIYNGSFPSFDTVPSTNSYNITEYLQNLWKNREITIKYNDVLPAVNKSNLCYVKLCSNCNTSSLDGSSWTRAYTTIQECIDKLDLISSTDKEIWVAKGSYFPTTTLPFVMNPHDPYFFSFVMYDDIRMYGGFNGTETLRSQRNWFLNPTYLTCDVALQCTIIMYAADNVIIDGFIFTGALYNISREAGSFSTVTTEVPTTTAASSRRILAAQTLHSTFSQELSDTGGGRGGGIFSNGTNIIVVNSIFFENLVVKGGGIYCIGYAGHVGNNKIYSSPTIINSAFVHNIAVRGGAIMGDLYCEFECESCLFDGNIATEKGGAIYLDYFCNITVNNSVFVNNIAYESGGCVADDGFSPAYLNNNIYDNNIAKWEGGCLYGGSHVTYSGTILFVENPTFINNSAYYGFDNIWLWPTDGVSLETQATTSSPVTTLSSEATTIFSKSSTLLFASIILYCFF